MLKILIYICFRKSHIRYQISHILLAKTRSDRDFEISLCYTPKALSCLEEIIYNINHCLELAPSFPKTYNIPMFLFNIAKLQS